MATTTDLARRPNGAAPAGAQPGAALELRAGQTMWTQNQHAALVAMGIPKTASSAELGVFLHQCQRTGLDPFSKQIYLIYRDSYEDGRYVKKPTTQVGIDGFRVIRDRIARRDGLRVEYEDTVWYDGNGTACEVWLWDDEKPAACKVTVVVDGRRFPAVLRFSEYAQKKKGGELNKMWSEKPAHMIEKCAEADALRKAFPNDMAGVILEDAAPLAEDEPPQRQRVTATQARQRGQQPARQVSQATGEIVDAQVVDDAPWPGDAEPAGPTTPGASSSAGAPGSGSPTATGTRSQSSPRGSASGADDPFEDPDPRNAILASLGALGVTGAPAIASVLSRLVGQPIASVESLSGHQAQWFADRLAGITTPDELEAAAVAAEAKRERENGAAGE